MKEIIEKVYKVFVGLNVIGVVLQIFASFYTWLFATKVYWFPYLDVTKLLGWFLFSSFLLLSCFAYEDFKSAGKL